MDALKIGDMVQVADGSYAKVYSFGHKEPDRKALFLQIATDRMMNGGDEYEEGPLLEISADHLLYVRKQGIPGNNELVPASMVKVGDALVSPSDDSKEQVVTSIGTVSSLGLYAPLTATGDIVVNGVVASNYVSRSWVSSSWISAQMLHWLQYGGTLPYRVYCSIKKGGCEKETYHPETGFSPFVQFWYEWEQWQLDLPTMGRWAFLAALAVPAACTFLVGQALASSVLHVIAVLLGYMIWKKACGYQANAAVTLKGKPKQML